MKKILFVILLFSLVACTYTDEEITVDNETLNLTKTKEAFPKEVETFEIGLVLEEQLKCAMKNLPSQNEELTTTTTLFTTKLNATKESLLSIESMLQEGYSKTEVTDKLSEAQASLMAAQDALVTALDILKKVEGELCDEETIEEKNTEEASQETTKEDSEKDLQDFLKEYGLETYYQEAQDAIDTLVDKIDEMEGYGYDVSQPEEYLTNAQKYLGEAEELILNGAAEDSISELLNAKSVAEQGMEAKLYVRSSVAKDKAERWERFATCMDDTEYLYERNDCYKEYSIDEDRENEIELCLTNADEENKGDCYDEE